MNRRTLIRLGGLAIADLLLSLWIGQKAYGWMPPQASAESLLVDDLFSFMTTVGSFIFFGVMGTLLYSIVFQRASKYDASDGPPVEGNLTLEVVWTVIPILLVIWIGTISYQTYDQMSLLGPKQTQALGTEMEKADVVALTDSAVDVGDSSSPIEVHARQWAWEFRYPDAAVSSTELHLPINQRARLTLSSDDVLHGFYVPAFRVKQDIVPGKAIRFEFTPTRPGRYRLRDSEYSGTYFATNQTHVVVESAEHYQDWLTTASATEPQPALNPAYEEFTRAERNGQSVGWPTVKPAPAPVVNDAS